MSNRKRYPSDVGDEEWAFLTPYLALIRVTSPQREHPLREVFNGLRRVVKTGLPWRLESQGPGGGLAHPALVCKFSSLAIAR